MVHISSCATIWPGGPSSPGQGTRHFDSEARSQEGDVYGITKRLQEEMCRQVYDHCQLPIIVLRPDGICDARQGLLGHPRRPFSPSPSELEGRDLDGLYSVGAVCRHDLAAACVSAAERMEPAFDILHTVGESEEAKEACNVARTAEVLGVRFAAPTLGEMVKAGERSRPRL